MFESIQIIPEAKFSLSCCTMTDLDHGLVSKCPARETWTLGTLYIHTHGYMWLHEHSDKSVTPSIH